jgi:hypothetical protein
VRRQCLIAMARMSETDMNVQDRTLQDVTGSRLWTEAEFLRSTPLPLSNPCKLLIA